MVYRYTDAFLHISKTTSENSFSFFWTTKPFKNLANRKCLLLGEQIQSNFNGSNTFGSMKISSRQGQFEPTRADYGVRSGGLNREAAGQGGLIGISFRFPFR